MAKNPAFSFYAQDYLVDTFQWNRSEKSLHVDLLAISWINGYIEANEQGEPVGYNEDDIKLWNGRVKHKWTLDNGRLTNAKQEEGREKRKKFLASQSDKGKKSAEKRAQKRKKVTKRKPTINHGSTAVEPQLNHLNTEYEKEKETELETEFGKSENLLPEPEQITWQMWVDAWFEFYKSRNDGVGPAFNGTQGMALQSIKAHLTKVGSVKNPDIPPEKAGYEAWQFVLEKWDTLDAWMQKQFDLSVIAQKINNIVNHMKKLKDGSHSKSSPGSAPHKPGTSSERVRAIRDY